MLIDVLDPGESVLSSVAESERKSERHTGIGDYYHSLYKFIKVHLFLKSKKKTYIQYR